MRSEAPRGHPHPAPDPIYLDYNATTPVDPRVIRASLPYLGEYFGNPSSSHAYGSAPRDAIAAARSSAAAVLQCTPREIVFTGGGSDGDTLAIRGAALARRHRGRHIITQQTEHPAVLAVYESLRRLHGFRITELPVDRHGLVAPAALAAELAEDTVLVSIMHANNETGTIQPIAELTAVAHEHGALMHTDASQSLGKIPCSVRGLGVDLATVTGHKIHAPKGVGALFVREGLVLEPAVYGGGQEGGLRGGTENVASIVALGEACRLLTDPELVDNGRLARLRDLLQSRLTRHLGDRVRLNGHPTLRLPNTLNISIEGTSGSELLASTPSVAASTGSACHEGDVTPSVVLSAMGVPKEQALAALRLTLGRWTTTDEVEQAAEALAKSVSRADCT
ncbi:cysteine desulfurase family protein [Streptomyces vastus]|uniref:cysteine desulfurase n=1 Tax=Streptomyces vastus TaxID=285451 RepID=A0ABP6CNP7_9ACTN